jgi:inosine/xanthosine triphosphate pyrophosphatase family protein
MKELGHDGLNKMLAAYEDKSAQAVCTFAYCAGPGREAILFEGRTNGKIVPARGPAFFGWDAVFEYEGQTYVKLPSTPWEYSINENIGTRRWTRPRRTRCHIEARRWIS